MTSVLITFLICLIVNGFQNHFVFNYSKTRNITISVISSIFGATVTYLLLYKL